MSATMEISPMRTIRSTLLLSAFATTLFTSAPASALPLAPATGGTGLATQLAAPLPTMQVRNGGAVAAGILGGMLLGGFIASQRPYYYGGYEPYPYYQSYYPAYRAYPGDPVAYCMRRFRSYDPYSMTYLGYDGFRHPCP